MLYEFKIKKLLNLLSIEDFKFKNFIKTILNVFIL